MWQIELGAGLVGLRSSLARDISSFPGKGPFCPSYPNLGFLRALGFMGWGGITVGVVKRHEGFYPQKHQYVWYLSSPLPPFLTISVGSLLTGAKKVTLPGILR